MYHLFNLSPTCDTHPPPPTAMQRLHKPLICKSRRVNLFRAFLTLFMWCPLGSGCSLVNHP